MVLSYLPLSTKPRYPGNSILIARRWLYRCAQSPPHAFRVMGAFLNASSDQKRTFIKCCTCTVWLNAPPKCKAKTFSPSSSLLFALCYGKLPVANSPTLCTLAHSCDQMLVVKDDKRLTAWQLVSVVQINLNLLGGCLS